MLCEVRMKSESFHKKEAIARGTQQDPQPGTMVDVGVFPGNYHDYESDEMAIQRTKEIVRDLQDSTCSWEDQSFPHGLDTFLQCTRN